MLHMKQSKVKEIVSQMTLDEKAAMTTGRTKWHTLEVERLGVAPVRMSDGPHGLRVERSSQTGKVPQDLQGLMFSNRTIHATCFPASCATAASFDRDLLREVGVEIGKQASALGVDLLLGPGINIKRTPLCGRNFEYFSEDPYLTGELALAYVEGVQSQNVGTSLKHFAANNQEHRRLVYSAQIDERTMREIYLQAFETVVKKAKPWTVMASYNKVNGVHSAYNKQLLGDILRTQWGFDGAVVSDWGAVGDRVAAVLAGCDLAMPGQKVHQQLINAIADGRLLESDLDACCERIILLSRKAAQRKTGERLDLNRGHAYARKAAAESMVLLKNEEQILPLKKEDTVAVIGMFAKTPRYQGGGSSCVETHMVSDLFSEAEKAGYAASYAQGYYEDGSTDDTLLAQAEATARKARYAIVVVGLTDSAEVESFDRSHLRLSSGHNTLVERVCEANENTVVVLMIGSPVELPWKDKPKAILNAYLGGEAVGEALLDVLYGTVNPSGRLPETFPIRLEDTPTHLCFPGERDIAQYNEGLYVGYRYYTSKEVPALYPFGYGLSYTTFSFSDLQVDKTHLKEGESLEVSVLVKNTGTSGGKAVIQLYVAPEHNILGVMRPKRELKEFAKVYLEPDEEKRVSFSLEPRAFTYWEPAAQDWRAEAGTYYIEIGNNAQDICLRKAVKMQAVPVPPEGGYTLQTPIGYLLRDYRGWQFVDSVVGAFVAYLTEAKYMPKQTRQMLKRFPVDGGFEAIQKADKEMDEPTGCMQVLVQLTLGMLEESLNAEKKQELYVLLQTLNGLNQEVML